MSLVDMILSQAQTITGERWRGEKRQGSKRSIPKSLRVLDLVFKRALGLSITYSFAYL